MQPSEDGQVYGGFRMAGALQYAAGFGPQGEDMPRLYQSIRCRIRVGQNADGLGAVVSAHARRNAVGGIHAYHEIRTMGLAVLRHHRPESEPFQLRLDRRHADNAAAVANHHVHGFRRCLGRRHDQITFVLPRFVICHHHEFPRDDISDGGVDSIKRRGGMLEVRCGHGRVGKPGRLRLRGPSRQGRVGQ